MNNGLNVSIRDKNDRPAIVKNREDRVLLDMDKVALRYKKDLVKVEK